MRVYTRRGGGVGYSGGWFIAMLTLTVQVIMWLVMALVIVAVYCGAALLALAGGSYLWFKDRGKEVHPGWADHVKKLWSRLTKKRRR